QRGKKLVRARSEFERQRNDMPPRVAPATETTREGAHRQNGNRESAVFAITRDDGAAELIGLDASGIFHQPLFRGANRGRKFFIRSRRAKRRPAKRCRADVADALCCVAPTAVGICIASEPLESEIDLRFEI